MNFPWIIFGLITILRLLIAAFGHVNETESYLLLCSHHLDWGFMEGPAGVPALMRISGILGSHLFILRCFSPLLVLGGSWILWRWISVLRNRETAFWTVIAFNALPLTNAASVVMEGTIVVACCWLAALWISWMLITNKIQKNKISTWLIFGFILAIGTQMTYQIGWLLLLVMIASLGFFQNELPLENESVVAFSGWKKFFGILAALFLLALSWLPIMLWNQHHDGLQFQNMTWDAFWAWAPWENDYFQQLPITWSLLVLVPLLIASICSLSGIWNIENPFFLVGVIPLFLCVNELGHEQVPFALILVTTALFLPLAIELLTQTQKRKIAGLLLLLLFGGSSLLLLVGKISTSTVQESSWDFPSARGVLGVEAVGEQLIKLRKSYADTSGREPFLIAEKPGLAAILGTVIPIDYPERPAAPSVFVAESPALTSQFQLWPNYADATTENATPDPLYTEEKAVSPFLGQDAFYITTEKLDNLPQSITSAFAAVVPLSLTFTLTKNGTPEQLNVYLCQHYQMLTL